MAAHALIKYPGTWSLALLNTKWRNFIVVSSFLLFSMLFWTLLLPTAPVEETYSTSPVAEERPDGPSNPFTPSVDTLAQYFIDFPVAPANFAEMGRRVQILQDWIQSSRHPRKALSGNVEAVVLSMFPFLTHPEINESETIAPFTDLRNRHTPGSRGIVIPLGKGTFRYGCHLVASLRNVHQSTLPIEIVYAGDDDLPQKYRRFITRLGPDISLTDVTEVFDDETLDLAHGKWALKPFATLASRFEQVITIDADAVFLQPPEAIFDHHTLYRKTGVLLFHDRLLFHGAYQNRHEWWKNQTSHQPLSETMIQSLVHNEDFAEEGDSGLVVTNKGRLGVLLGLLHIAWQNSKVVREEFTYRMGHGDKESWWFGFELSNVPYSFAEHYGGMIGKMDYEAEDPPAPESASSVKRNERQTAENSNDLSTAISTEESGANLARSSPSPVSSDPEPIPSASLPPEKPGRICSFTISHVDENDDPLWMNGSLLKNKLGNATEYWIPDVWMLDGDWQKGGSRASLSCMQAKHGLNKGKGEVMPLPVVTMQVIAANVAEAQKVDKKLEARGLRSW